MILTKIKAIKSRPLDIALWRHIKYNNDEKSREAGGTVMNSWWSLSDKNLDILNNMDSLWKMMRNAAKEDGVR